MKLERQTDRDGNLYPEVYNYLNSLPDNVIFHSNYSERHPLSIYSLSIQRIVEAFEAVLDEIDLIYTALFDADGDLNYRLDKLPKLQKELLSSLQSHIDDCFRILKTIHPPIDKKEIFVERWLEKAKHPTYKNFKNAVQDYRNSFFPIVNKIKHNGGQLRSLLMYSGDKPLKEYHSKTGIKLFPHNARIVGYYIEGVQSDDCIGADPEIHPGGNTAISFNRDLRLHFANLYRIGCHLKRAVVKAVQKLHGVKLAYHTIVKNSPRYQELETIAERVNRLPYLFFPNEISKKTPGICYFRSVNSSKLILNFPGSDPVKWHGSTKIFGEFQVDSVYLKYKLPYFGKE